MFKVTWARLCVYSGECMDECTFWMYAWPSARLGCTPRPHDARVGRVLGSVVHGAWFGRDVCALVHGSVATQGLVAHVLIFLWMIEPCG